MYWGLNRVDHHSNNHFWRYKLHFIKKLGLKLTQLFYYLFSGGFFSFSFGFNCLQNKSLNINQVIKLMANMITSISGGADKQNQKRVKNVTLQEALVRGITSISKVRYNFTNKKSIINKPILTPNELIIHFSSISLIYPAYLLSN